uniref:Thylakoid lumenal 17.9 kDa protein, chloroplastic n=1 Tax=Quercus lobata TaxID=97700 RepID=A0A7N2MM40_QUELO
MNLIGHLLPPLPSTSSKPSTPKTSLCLQIPETTSLNPNPKPILLSKLLSLALAATLSSPLPSLAIPSFNSQSFQLPPSPTTPFSESKTLETGLENGKIRPCPSTNPGCVSTNPKSSSFAFPWTIPENSSGNAIQMCLDMNSGIPLKPDMINGCSQDFSITYHLYIGVTCTSISRAFFNPNQKIPVKLQEAILKTQKNAKIQVVEDTPNGQYLQAEVDDGGFGRDVLEFLVKGDVVAYRSIATKVTYVYPFTTALGDSKGQEERMKKIIDQLGWYAPSFDTMD